MAPAFTAGLEQFVSLGQATVTAGGTTAPAAGTVESWTLSASTLPGATNGSLPPTFFCIADTANAASSEVILVTNISGATATVTRGYDGTTPVAHTLNFTVEQVLSGATARGLQVGWQAVPASGDTTGATDTPLLQTMLNAGYLRLVPGASYYINALLNIPGYCTIEGGGANENSTAFIRMANATNLAAVIASTGWAGSTNANSVPPVTIRNLQIDANQSNQTSGAGHGLVLQSYGSRVENVTVQNTRGDSFRFDFFGANGTSGIGNTMVECRWIRCKSIAATGSGFVTTDPTSTSSITDGYIVDCVVQSATVRGININASAGWKVDGNHIYGTPGVNAGLIDCERPFWTRIVNNFIENLGQPATAATYTGIQCGNCQSFNGAIIANNHIAGGVAGNAGSLTRFIDCDVAAGLTADMVIVGNQMAYTGTIVGTVNGIVTNNGSAGSTTNVVTTGNQAAGNFSNATQFNAGGGTVNHTAGV